MTVVVGLHNPGPEYAGTRHNVGAEVVSDLAERHHCRFRRAKRGTRAVIAEYGAGPDRVTLLLPTTFMNESGQAVAPVLDYAGASADDLLVVHDDIDLPFGRVRAQHGRGPGGHNGVSSIIGSVGTREFWRLKLGVGRPPGSMDPADYVLKRFAKSERPGVDAMVDSAVDLVELFVSAGPEAARQAAGEIGPA